MSPVQVEFFFDYGSPYSYLASFLIGETCRKGNATLHYEPVVLGGIFKEKRITPAHADPQKRHYMFQDLRNLASFHGLPYRERTVFLFNPLTALRATLQIPQGPEREPAVAALFRGAFGEDLDLGQPEVVARLLTEAGCDGDALVAGAQGQDVKDRLRERTERAMALGVFGAPTFLLNDTQLFWGHDRLPVLEYFMTKATRA